MLKKRVKWLLSGWRMALVGVVAVTLIAGAGMTALAENAKAKEVVDDIEEFLEGAKIEEMGNIEDCFIPPLNPDPALTLNPDPEELKLTKVEMEVKEMGDIEDCSVPPVKPYKDLKLVKEYKSFEELPPEVKEAISELSTK